MKFSSLFFFGIFLGGSLFAQSASPESCRASEPGTYYATPDGWVSMSHVSASGGGLKHAGKMFVPGLTPQMVWTYRKAQAPVQLGSARPEFCIKQVPQIAQLPGYSSHDLLLIRLDKKKDHRELQTTSGGNMFTFKAGISGERLPDVHIQKWDDGAIMLVPARDLSSGEYMITFSALGTSGYDFGIH